ncbi:MAG: class I SAM-dependent methyltransferase [Fusobacterium sp. JB021]|nr:class I SAM-dependent methyltransferase [Fusobacterium sp. JB021]MDP0505624.1 class I SAM-dependent methyltransferase [Fusobacterium sp. JB019]
MYKNFSKVYDKFMEFCNYDEWTELLEENIKKNLNEARKILDLGCGTGEILKRLSNKYTCSGLDLSEHMLNRANEKCENVRLYLGDMREFDTYEKYDVIFSFFDTINHLTSLEELLDTLNSVKNSLEPGGIYVFDVVDRNFMDKMFSNGIFADVREDFSVIWEHEKYEETSLDVIEATYFLKNEDNLYEKYEEYYEKKIFTDEEIERVIKISGLKKQDVFKNNRLAGERKFFVLKKI